MRRRALWIAGAVTALAVLSATPQQRADARKRLARWNPLFIALIVAMLAFVLWPWPPRAG